MALQPLKKIPEWWELCARYRYDIYAFAVEALGITPREVINTVTGWQDLYRFEYENSKSHVYNKSHILCLVELETKSGWKAGDTMEVLVSKWLEWPEETKRQFAAYELKHVRIERAVSLGECECFGFVLDGDATFKVFEIQLYKNVSHATVIYCSYRD